MQTLQVPTAIDYDADAKQRTRIVLFTNSIAVGGMETHVELLARHLDRQQFEVFAIYPAWEPTDTFFQALGNSADHSAVITPDRRHGFVRQMIETLKLVHQLRVWRVEVFHMHSTTYRGQMLASLAARLAGVHHIYVTEHLAPEQPVPLWERLLRTLFSSTIDGFVCVSEKNYLARKEYTYIPDERTIIVTNGVDCDDFSPTAPEQVRELRARYALPLDARVVGTAIRFEPEKGMNYLVSAMPAIVAAYPDTYFLLVGDGSLRTALEAQVAAIGMTAYVRFVGFQSDPRPYIGLMDAFVLPVPVGSMSIGLLEAMAMRRAVVITFGGHGEAVVHGVSGFCAEPRNAASIAHYVSAIVQDPHLQKRLGNAARYRVEHNFSAQRVARVLGTMYRNGVAYTKGVLADIPENDATETHDR